MRSGGVRHSHRTVASSHHRIVLSPPLRRIAVAPSVVVRPPSSPPSHVTTPARAARVASPRDVAPWAAGDDATCGRRRHRIRRGSTPCRHCPHRVRSPLPRLSRRLLLASGTALAGASLLTGCSDDSDAASRRHAKAEATAAQKLSRGAARDSADLTARYDATLAAHPGLDATLRPLRAQVTRHREAFDAAGRGATW
ncbi:hypothetical protein GA0115246_102524, partial [Streptomyces sp. SolWspMP-sol7th]